MSKISRNWKFYDFDTREKKGPFVIVDLPHTNLELPLQYFDTKSYQFTSTYVKELTINKKTDKVYLLEFEGFMTSLELYINNEFAGSFNLGFVGFTLDITKYLVNGVNEIVVYLDSREIPSIPPFGGLVDYLTFGGIYRDVHLHEKPVNYIKDVKISFMDGLLSINVVGEGLLGKTSISIIGDNVSYTLSKDANSDVTFDCSSIINELRRWSVDDPYLYKVIVNSEFDSVTINYGFRTFRWKNGVGFVLNDKPIKLHGLNRHQAYPYIGYAASENANRIDARILKEYGVNIVRSGHYPQSKCFFDECDKIGLLVFTEVPGWQYIGDKEWQDNLVEYVREMIHRDYNHPSIVFWGVRANETFDNDELYKRTNDLARSLDPTRYTSGVRFLTESHLLEDVFAFNEFLNIDNLPMPRDQHEVTGLDREVPYLITEFQGHMYPTRKNNNEQRLVNHALGHLKMYSDVNKMSNIGGAIGWCYYDYNTHFEFGSGDKICYHGVFDIFRMPKFAAYVYKSQIDPNREVVLEPLTFWGYGERSGGGVTPLYILSNVDSLVMKVVGKEPIQLQRDPSFSGLAYPPFICPSLDGAWGAEWKDVVFSGHINNKLVIKRELLADQVYHDFKIRLYDKKLIENEMTRIEVELIDRVGNILHLASDIIMIKVTNGKLIGPELVNAYCGSYAFYVRSDRIGKLGVSITIRGQRKRKVISVIGGEYEK